VASAAPVRAFDDDATTFGAVVTAVLGAIFGATFGAALGAAVLRAAATLAAPAQSGAAAATGAGCAGTGTSSAHCGRPAVSDPNTTVRDATLGRSGNGPTDVPVRLTPITPR